MVVLGDTFSSAGQGGSRKKKEGASNFGFCPSKAFSSEDVNERSCHDLDF